MTKLWMISRTGRGTGSDRCFRRTLIERRIPTEFFTRLNVRFGSVATGSNRSPVVIMESFFCKKVYFHFASSLEQTGKQVSPNIVHHK